MLPVKYQRTYHLPDSPGLQNDDRRVESIEQFIGQEVVVTEKMDGENTTMYNGKNIHARSLSSGIHPSRTVVRSVHGNISYLIPNNMRICGENMYAKHSIFYNKLPAYFLVFAIFVNDEAVSWDDIERLSESLGLQTVPVLYRGIWDEEIIKRLYTGQSVYGGEQEGYVVRLARSYPKAEEQNIVKYVRKNHIQSDEHWMTQAVVPNQLA